MSIETLLSWAHKEGATFPNLIIQGRCFKAKNDIQSGETFLSLPQKLLMTAKRIENNDYQFKGAFQALKDKHGKIDERHILVLLLILERARGNSSFWAPYLQILPQSYDDPCWWSEDEVQILEGTRLYVGAKQARDSLQYLAKLRDSLLQFCREMDGPELDYEWMMSDKAITWARSSVWSRAFNVRLQENGGKISVCMCPVSDLLNHNPKVHVAWHTGPQSTENFQFITYTKTLQGDEIFSNYGNKSNEELILGYGFALEENTADFFHVSLGQGSHQNGDDEQACRLVQNKMLARKIGLPQDHYLRLDHPLPPTLIACATLYMMPPYLLQELLYAHFAGGSDSQNQTEMGRKRRGEKLEKDTEPKKQNIQTAVHHLNNPDSVQRNHVPIEVPSFKENSEISQIEPPSLPVCPILQLRVLQVLNAQLQSKLNAIRANSQDKQNQLQSGVRSGEKMDEEIVNESETQASGFHQKMAIDYVRKQKTILSLGLQEVSKKISALLLKSSQAALKAGVISSGKFFNSSENSGVIFSPGCSFLKPTGIVNLENEADSTLWSLVRKGAYSGSRGLKIEDNISVGTCLFEIEEKAMILGKDENELIFTLIKRACEEKFPNPQSSLGEERFPIIGDLLAASMPVFVNDFDLIADLPLYKMMETELEDYKDAFEDFQNSYQEPGLQFSKEAEFSLFCWAMNLVQESAIQSPKGPAILPGLASIPEDLRGALFDIEWIKGDDESLNAKIISKISLYKGTCLCKEIMAMGQSADDVPINFGPHIFSRLYKATKDDKGLEKDLGGRWLHYVYDAEANSERQKEYGHRKREIAIASGFGFTYYITQHTLNSNLDPIYAAEGFKKCSKKKLKSVGSSELLLALKNAQNDGPRLQQVAGVHSDSSSSQENDVPDEETLIQCQEQFWNSFTQDKGILKDGRRSLLSHLEGIKKKNLEAGSLSDCHSAESPLEFYRFDFNQLLLELLERCKQTQL